MITIPLSLYPRSTGLIRRMEILSDCVLELTPFAHGNDLDLDHSVGMISQVSSSSSRKSDNPQGMVKFHKLPVYHERGGGPLNRKLSDELQFIVSRRGISIRPYNLPPAATEASRVPESRQQSTSGSNPRIDF